MVLHELHDRVDRLPPEVLFAAASQRVGLVDQERAAERRLEHGTRACRGLPDVAGDEVRPVGLDEVALGDDRQRAQDLAEQPGDGRLAGARVAGEHEVVAGLQRRQAALGPDALDPQQARQPPDVGLDLARGRPARRARRAAPRSCGPAAGRPVPWESSPRRPACRRRRRMSGRRRREPVAPAERHPPRRTPAAARRGSRRWRRSRRATARGRSTPRRERGGRRRRSSAPPAPCRRGRRRARAGRTACSVASATTAGRRASRTRGAAPRTRAPVVRGANRCRRARPRARRPSGDRRCRSPRRRCRRPRSSPPDGGRGPTARRARR